MRKDLQEFIAYGCIMTGVFLLLVNIFTGVGQFWVIYPLAVLFCPLIWLLIENKTVAALIISVLFFAACVIQNLIEMPQYLWFVFIIPLSVVFPIIVGLGRAAWTRATSYIISLFVIVFYLILNLYFEPRFFWSIFIIFGLVWWPMSMTFWKKTRVFSIMSAGWIILFFSVLNLMTTPEIFWAIHPIFAVLWWPFSIYLAKMPFRYGVFGALVTIAYFSILNALISPNQIWAVYPAFAIAWWPLSVYYFVSCPEKANHFET
ncbi:hypothetical protein NIE88_14655 [Sporolactobacillus shoreicorticis]|uniref:Integral membrane protein n=1 Tax=Sporolactobacillus shoreicorticis TaxID=1923877 RepID=A0ABW5S0P7_9BACL|nr:hypothetical protein [Sporolactobacillus shoreicorticis]MCO7127008.1 hypothetical protein [Sporolactobacillus shoreicorticis]